MLRKGFLSVVILVCLSQRIEPQDGPPSGTRDAGNATIWRDPGNVETLDFAGGPGGREGAPQPPFVFREAPSYGTNPKIIVSDARNSTWEMKWGPEVKAEPFATRLLWAVGYHVEPSYYVPEGQVEGAGHLDRGMPRHDRQTSVIDRSKGNAFSRARFELRDPRITFVKDLNWAWESNPFVNSREFAGLKIMTMLVSNWDTKDSTSSRSANTAIVKFRNEDGTEESRYLVNDWGASMGKWGSPMTHTSWDCQGYKEQTPYFVKGLDKNGMVRFGYTSQTQSMSQNISPEHVAWLMGYLGRITDDQIRDGLRASNADSADLECFATAVRSRIEQLRAVSGHPVLSLSR
jgi:hypothetical protein